MVGRALAAAAVICSLLVASAHAQGPPAQRWAFADDLAVSPDGRFVYAVGSSTLVFERDPDSGRLRLLAGNAPGGQFIEVAPDGGMAHVAGWERLYTLSRDPRSGLLVHQSTYAAQSRLIEGLSQSADGLWLFGNGQGYGATAPAGVELLEPDSSSYSVRPAGFLAAESAPGAWLDRVVGTATAPDGAVVVGGSSGVGLLARDAGSGQIAASTATEQGSWPGVVALSPDGRRLYRGWGAYEVYDRDPETGALTLVQSVHEHCRHGSACGGMSIAPTPDGARVFNADTDDHAILQARVTAAGVEPEHLYVHGEDGFEGVESPTALAWSADGRELYVAGTGATSGGRDGSVIHYRWDPAAARLRLVGRFDPVIPILGRGDGRLEIEAGARYTNDREVTLGIVPTAGASSVRLSNSGDFSGVHARALEPDGEYEWTLAETGPSSVRRVHARFMDRVGQPARELTASIVLDERRPRVLSARLDGNVLRLRARDDRSGISEVRLKRRRSGAATVRKLRFRRRIGLSRSTPRRWVRVVDGAGNRSEWRRVRAAPHRR